LYVGFWIRNIITPKDLLSSNLSWINIVDYAQNIEEINSEYEKFVNFSIDAKKINILTNNIRSNFSIDDPNSNKQKIEYIYKNFSKRFKIEEISWWYIHIIASVNWWELNPKESVYIYLNNEWWHLFRPQSIIKSNIEDGKTHIIFKLDNVKFTTLPTRWYDETKEMKTFSRNFLSELNNKTNYIFWFVSTNRFWELEKIEIIYK
jgi:hypothetical protein